MDSLELNYSYLKFNYNISKIFKIINFKFFYLLFININIKLKNLIFRLSNESKRLFDSILFEFNKGLLPLFKFPYSYIESLLYWVTLEDFNSGLILKLKEYEWKSIY